MNKIISRNILRTILVLVVQLLLLKRNLTLGEFNYLHLTIYPIIIVLLPYDLPRIATIVIGFSLGLFVDFFYDSLGVHAGAMTLVAYLRQYILLWIIPREGYKSNGLTAYNYGIAWFLTYVCMIFIVHLFVLYSLEAFSFVYFKEIFLRTVFSFMGSVFLIMFGSLIFNPKY